MLGRPTRGGDVEIIIIRLPLIPPPAVRWRRLGHHAWAVNPLILNRSTSAFYCSVHHLKACIVRLRPDSQRTRYRVQ